MGPGRASGRQITKKNQPFFCFTPLGRQFRQYWRQPGDPKGAPGDRRDPPEAYRNPFRILPACRILTVSSQIRSRILWESPQNRWNPTRNRRNSQNPLRILAESYRILWNPMESHRILWNPAKSCRILRPRNPGAVESYRILQNPAKSCRILQNPILQNPEES